MTFSQDFKDVGRLNKVISVFIKQGFGYLFEGFKIGNLFHRKTYYDESIKSMKKASRLRVAFEELGPTFVKLGQLLSLRPDLIPKEYCDEFTKLQDNVAPFAFERVKKIVESELKLPLHEIFHEFAKEPIASASIGQVHKAKLKNGEEVVVKVQRPDIKDPIETDIDLMYKLADILEKRNPDLQQWHLPSIVREFDKYTHEELDYSVEGQHINLFNKNFLNDPNIEMPKVYWDYTTKKVLMMSYLDGKKITDVSEFEKIGLTRQRVAEVSIDCYLKQVFDFGVFHADPHPANIFVLKNGKIAYLDFGIIGRLNEELREKLLRLFIFLMNKDVEGVLETITHMGVVGEDVNKEALREDISAKMDVYYNVPLNDMDVGKLLSDIFQIAIKYHVKLPSDLVMLSKGIITIESVCEELYPDLNIVEVAKPYVNRILKDEVSPIKAFKRLLKDAFKFKEDIKKLPGQTSEILDKLKEGELRVKFEHKDLKDLELEIARSSNQMANGIIIAALLIGGGLVWLSGRSMWIANFAFIMAGILSLILVYSMIEERRAIK